MKKFSNQIFVASIIIFILIACSKEAIVESPFEKADGVKGGMLYNTFWDNATGFDQKHPNFSKFKTNADFFKCKQCHAWDREGNTASYINRGPNAKRPRVAIPIKSISASYSPQQLFDAIKTGKGGTRRPVSWDPATYNPSSNSTEGDKMPNYSEILTDTQIWDLVKFLKNNALDVKDFYDYTTSGTYPTGKIVYSNIGKGGDPVKGKELFNSKSCNSGACHGSKGNAFKVDNATFTVGSFIRSKPNEAQHKIQFGQLESSNMPAYNLTLQQMKDLYAALTDTLAFPNK